MKLITITRFMTHPSLNGSPGFLGPTISIFPALAGVLGLNLAAESLGKCIETEIRPVFQQCFANAHPLNMP